MLCPNCGKENIADAVYCASCGSFVLKSKPIYSNELTMPRQKIREAIDRRKETDRILNPLMVVFPYVFLMITTIVLSIAVFVDALRAIEESDGLSQLQDNYRNLVLWLAIVSCGLNIILGTITYFLIKRMNEHSARENELRVAVHAYFQVLEDGQSRQEQPRSPWSSPYENELLVPDVVKIRSPMLWMMIIASPIFMSIVQVFILSTHDLSNLLNWTILLLPVSGIQMILMIYMFYFMMNEIYYHDVRWNEFVRTVKVRFARAGFIAGDLPEERIMVDRSFGLYLLLTFILSGLFIIYWWYTILKDPNDHFKKQWRFENALLRYITPGA